MLAVKQTFTIQLKGKEIMGLKTKGAVHKACTPLRISIPVEAQISRLRVYSDGYLTPGVMLESLH